MTNRTEGTFVLDGLIEGHLPASADAVDRLRRWVDLMRKLGLEVELEVDGGSFSLLANESKTQVSRLGPDPAFPVRDAIEQLVASLDDPAAAG
ncbi:MAG: hypothetical protein ACC662_10325, partial [Planctomycetota bacterium]